MSDRRDLFKSLVWGAADLARRKVQDAAPVAAAKKAFETLKRRDAELRAEALGAAFAAVPDVVTAMATVDERGVHVDAERASGERVQVTLVPKSASFAPGGAKELAFDVEPPERAREPLARHLAGALGEAIAFTVWNAALRTKTKSAGVAADLEIDGLRIDLRNVPAVRAALANPGTRLLVETLSVTTLHCERGALKIAIGLRGMTAP